MKVIATQTGYYNHIRIKEDTVFDLTDEKHFSKNWMKKVEEPGNPKSFSVDFEFDSKTGKLKKG